jgi:predicted RNA-binding protein
MVCLATVYLENDGQREEVMRDVAGIVAESGGLQLFPFLGEGKRFQARIKSIDLVRNSIVLARIVTDPPQAGFGDQKEGSASIRGLSMPL